MVVEPGFVATKRKPDERAAPESSSLAVEDVAAALSNGRNEVVAAATGKNLSGLGAEVVVAAALSSGRKSVGAGACGAVVTSAEGYLNAELIYLLPIVFECS